MTPAIETTDHDQGPPPLYCGSGGFLVPIMLDGHRWALLPPGDPVVAHLVNHDVEGHGHAPR